MKLPALILLALLSIGASFGQSPASTDKAPAAKSSEPVRFNLDFPGGTPKELAAAIAKASGKPCNLIAGPSAVDVKLPAIKVEGVTMKSLFLTLNAAGQGPIKQGGGVSYGQLYNFISITGDSAGDETVWAVMTMGPIEGVPQCRFYNLAPYLDDFTVDDITTASTTGWDLLNEAHPKLSFHKETKLLIVVGQPEQLEIVEKVLKQLSTSITKKAPALEKVSKPQ